MALHSANEAGELHVHEGEFLDEDAPQSQSRPSSTGLASQARAAQVASMNVEGRLRDLLRTIKFLEATMDGAYTTNLNLVHELDTLSATLERQNLDFAALQQRALDLEDALLACERKAASERQFLIAEQDAFIAGLVQEHARSLQALEQRLRAQQPASDDPNAGK